MLPEDFKLPDVGKYKAFKSVMKEINRMKGNSDKSFNTKLQSQRILKQYFIDHLMEITMHQIATLRDIRENQIETLKQTCVNQGIEQKTEIPKFEFSREIFSPKKDSSRFDFTPLKPKDNKVTFPSFVNSRYQTNSSFFSPE